MKSTNLVGLIAAPLMVFAWSVPAWAADSTAATTCKDGTTWTGTHRGGASNLRPRPPIDGQSCGSLRMPEMRQSVQERVRSRVVRLSGRSE